MLLKPKTQILFDNSWLNQLKFEEHTDYDLAGHVSAIALKSESGKVFDFYRSDPIEKPENFKLTAVCDKFKEAKDLVDFFSFIETTRVRIHKQEPGQHIPLHTDGNNVEAKTKEEYRLRMITALTADSNFIYEFEHEGIFYEYDLKLGESIIFDPDTVAHGMRNKSKTKTRLALVQIFKSYPMHRDFVQFINRKQLIKI